MLGAGVTPMKILLISANTEKINMPTLPMGLGCVAAALEGRGHAVSFLDLMAVEEWQPLLSAALSNQPDLIGISIRNIDDQVSYAPRFLLDRSREVVAFCRSKAHAPIVLGGAGYSIFPEQVLEYTGADMGIQGEGETAFALLLERLSAGNALSNVPGLYIKGKGLQAPRAYARDLDRFPLPGPDLFDRRWAADPGFFLPVQTRRGCPLKCSYCSTPRIEGRVLRKRSPTAVVEALAGWRAAGFSQIYFVDNIFNLPESYAVELCDRMADAGLDICWRAILYPAGLSEKLVRSMARAGCRDVALGFESGSQPVLDRLNKRFTPADVAVSSRLLADHGIGRMGFLLLGGPGETRETVSESLAFVEKLDLEAVKVTIGLRIYPHTELARVAACEGVLEAHADLLQPRFYMAAGMEEWLRTEVQSRLDDHRNWMM
jgi:radical SAM superfamily enzyme YgiQ (UPF0313 family)